MIGIRAKASLTALTLTALLPGLAFALGFGDVRLHSTLNAPLDAEIGIAATPDELAGLKAGIASRESFARNGLDYPNFLASATVTVAKAADGSDMLRVRTSDPVTEPFVTMLIEVNYTRGRLLREYTVLLDPPVLGNQAVNGPISAPVASTAAASAPVAPAPAAAAAKTAAAPMRPASGNNYRVQRGDSLSAIAARQLPGVDRSKALLGIYRANPEAFDGNMNLLRAGAELRLPSETELAALSPAEASSEVSSQYRSWRGAGRLRLVPPGEAAPPAAATTGSGSGGAAAESPGLRRQVEDLQKQLAETQRLLQLRSEQLAQLQNQSAQKGTPPVRTAPAAAVSPPAAQPAPSTSAPAPAVSAPPETAAPPAAPTPQVAAAPKPAAAAAPVAEAAKPSLLHRMLEQ
jgi:pilus assembly protein FimV